MRWGAWLAVLLLACAPADARRLELAPIFREHAVLQRDEFVEVRGWAPAGERVTVALNGEEAQQAMAGDDGSWCVTLPPQHAGGPRTLDAWTRTELVRRRDLLFGDVYIIAGQSNADWPLELAERGFEDVPEAYLPAVRLWRTMRTLSIEDAQAVEGWWHRCEPERAKDFSAIGYYVARRLNFETGVPVGVIQCTWPGSPIEPWIPRADLMARPEHRVRVEGYEAALAALPHDRRAFAEELRRWQDAHFHRPTPNRGESRGWALPELDDNAWETMPAPATWESATALRIDGAVWFRREVHLPAAFAGRPLELQLGVLDDMDTTYFNGAEIGRTGRETPNYWKLVRHYPVPGGLVRAGRNVIAIRIFDHFNRGGFRAFPGDFRAVAPWGTEDDAISLAGPWRYCVEHAIAPKRGPRSPEPKEPPRAVPEHQPGGIWGGMASPLLDVPVRGVVWYQGESNAASGAMYGELLEMMVGAWRRRAGRDLEFYVVELPAFDYPWKESAEALRAGQRAVADRDTGVFLVPADDLGDPADIHPKRKRALAERIAEAILARNSPLHRDTPPPSLSAWTPSP